MMQFLVLGGAAWLSFALLDKYDYFPHQFWWMALLPLAFLTVIALLRD